MVLSINSIFNFLEILFSEREMLNLQLDTTRDKLKSLNGILSKKSEKREVAVREADNLFAVGGVKVSEFRLPRHRIKVNVHDIMRKRLFKTEAEPAVHIYDTPKGLALEAIRHRHTVKHHAKEEIEHRNKLEAARKQHEEIIAKKKAGKVFPTVSVPASMFPNRYVRGELPCTIEHGIKGWYLR